MPENLDLSTEIAQKCSKGNRETFEQNHDVGLDRNELKKYRDYSYTDYNEVPTVFDEKTMRYLCLAPEVCPSTGKPHWQSYVVFKTQKSMRAGLKCLRQDRPTAIWIEPSRGTANDNRQYIYGPYRNEKLGKTKPSNDRACEFGDIPTQGARKDVESLRDEILAGKSVDTICLDSPHMYHQYGRTLSKLEDIVLRQQYRTEMTKGIWLWGETGVGKSHEAFKNYTPETHYVLNIDEFRHGQAGWCDGYIGQETVIINDFRGEIAYNQLLTMVDKWPYNLKRRGREPVPFMAKTVIITSSLPPEDIYVRQVNKRDSLKQLLRRFEIRQLTRL
jgi:hypothetical protein